MTDEFKNHPQSLTEVKGLKSGYGRDWTPRDVLITMLRDIDEGNINPDDLIVVYRTVTDEGLTKASFKQSTPDAHITLGMLVEISQIILSS